MFFEKQVKLIGKKKQVKKPFSIMFLKITLLVNVGGICMRNLNIFLNQKKNITPYSITCKLICTMFHNKNIV